MMSEQKKEREKRLLKRHALETQDEDDNSAGIDVNILERRLEGLRDTQESVQGLSLWCQTNKRHSSVIIETWLRILRKSTKHRVQFSDSTNLLLMSLKGKG